MDELKFDIINLNRELLFKQDMIDSAAFLAIDIINATAKITEEHEKDGLNQLELIASVVDNLSKHIACRLKEMSLSSEIYGD